MQLSLFDSLQDNFIEAQRRLDEARKHYDDTKKLRDDNCEHRVVDSKNSYFGGSYYDTAYTDYWTECTICGAKSPVTTKYHSYHG